MVNKLKAILSFFLIYFSCNYNSIAQKIGECVITPEIWSMGILPKAENSNNLTKSYASFNTAKGKKIMITGAVLDANCVPISGAKVSIWQANAKGVFQLNSKHSKHFDKYFKSSGSMITDNVGNFQFVSIYPGKVNNFTPYIIFRIEHTNFMPVETKMFFPEHDNDYTIKSMNNTIIKEQIPLLIAKKISKKNGMPQYSFIITLKQIGSYKEY